MRVVIVDEEMGIYLGSFIGLGIWSLLDHAGQSAACTFVDEDDARDFVSEWETVNDPNRFKYVTVDPDLPDDYVSVHGLLRAGLGAKVGLMILDEPAAPVPEATRKWYVAGGIYTTLDWDEIEPGTFQFHGPFATEKDADQCWRAEMSKKIDTCMHKLRVVDR